MSEITAICQECGKQFEYVLKPGFPRKYCFECGEIKKQEFDDRSKPENQENIPVVKPGEVGVGKATPSGINLPDQTVTGYSKPYAKDPVGLAVDIFCALAKLESPKSMEERMIFAINLVKQAQESFE